MTDKKQDIQTVDIKRREVLRYSRMLLPIARLLSGGANSVLLESTLENASVSTATAQNLFKTIADEISKAMLRTAETHPAPEFLAGINMELGWDELMGSISRDVQSLADDALRHNEALKKGLQRFSVETAIKAGNTNTYVQLALLQLDYIHQMSLYVLDKGTPQALARLLQSAKRLADAASTYCLAD